MTVTCFALGNDAAWDTLRSSIDPLNRIEAVEATLAHLRSVGALSVVIENEYLDQDFTAEFARFYATVFKRYSKICRRLHFFSVDVSPILALDPQALAERLNGANQTYLGFCVVRPLTHAPLGRTVLAGPVSPSDRSAKLLVRGDHVVHLLGATLSVTGFPFAQQDSRISSCAQATMWMAGRHFHVEHKGPWFSTVDVTEAASQPTDTGLSMSLPAGSGGLDLNNMVRALRAMGREPFAYIAPAIDKSVFPATIDWTNTLRPREIINRYIDSGIPVILGLLPWEQGQPVGHAVVAVGHTVKPLDVNTALPDRPTRAEFTECFLVHDDQRGVTRQMPLVGGAGIGATPYSLQNVAYIIVPLPKKVFINAEAAEPIAWQLLSSQLQTIWASLQANHAALVAPIVAEVNDFIDKVNRNLVIVWVTEFGLFNDLNHLDARNRRIVCHSVIDATSSNFWQAVSVFHAPGFILRWLHDPQNPTGEFKSQGAVILNNSSYRPKIRGTL